MTTTFNNGVFSFSKIDTFKYKYEEFAKNHNPVVAIAKATAFTVTRRVHIPANKIHKYLSTDKFSKTIHKCLTSYDLNIPTNFTPKSKPINSDQSNNNPCNTGSFDINNSIEALEKMTNGEGESFALCVREMKAIISNLQSGCLPSNSILDSVDQFINLNDQIQKLTLSLEDNKKQVAIFALQDEIKFAVFNEIPNIACSFSTVYKHLTRDTQGDFQRYIFAIERLSNAANKLAHEIFNSYAGVSLSNFQHFHPSSTQNNHELAKKRINHLYTKLKNLTLLQTGLQRMDTIQFRLKKSDEILKEYVLIESPKTVGTAASGDNPIYLHERTRRLIEDRLNNITKIILKFYTDNSNKTGDKCEVFQHVFNRFANFIETNPFFYDKELLTAHKQEILSRKNASKTTGKGSSKVNHVEGDPTNAETSTVSKKAPPFYNLLKTWTAIKSLSQTLFP